ncbi:MAG: hypothetical protein LBN02_04490 [Oscillospiraceae bacterium]|nr:hypothetical protein [Oscillospiraceae bacterium]
MPDTAVNTSKFLYVIHGVIPELMPETAFRRECRELQYKRKILKCPHCGKRLTDTGADTKVELFRHPEHVQIDCQFYMKCTFCKGEVGINVI